jgi:hypothetical protein
MIGIPLGLLYANMGEWVLHKYVLHTQTLSKDKKPAAGTKPKKRGFFSYHWFEHHRAARENDNYDGTYERSIFEWNSQSKEVVSLVGLGILHAPLLPVAPFFTLTLFYSTFNYYRVHKRSHLDVEWGKENVPWHVDHHLGPDQNANWCVTKPWFDHVMGTRKPYLGTPKYEEDQKRRAARRTKSQNAPVNLDTPMEKVSVSPGPTGEHTPPNGPS